MKWLWRKLCKPLVRLHIVETVFVSFIVGYLRLVYRTNSRIKESHDPQKAHHKYNPFIITFWHGRHIMGPFLRPHGESVLTLFSRSADAELNARVGEKFGLEIVRGSGGRAGRQNPEKGGSRALLLLNRSLRNGKTVAMTADIVHEERCKAGRGIILLAKLSGRPIIPYVYAFSREKILEKTWDKTAIPLPFGRSVFLMGKALFIPQDADETLLEQKRQELTRNMNQLTKDAYLKLRKNTTGN